VAAPTRDIGSIDQRDALGTQLADLQEYVPDLQWPLSVPMYGRMRHDPKLAAILKAYSLPIRRATWAVDPAGCRDEVVQVVADDLGLPILGTDTEPGPARRRGVDWGEHLRLALLSLVYGFACFERRYEIRGGQARLVNLGERMQWTISEIDLNRDGTIRQVVQDIAASRGMPANRLLWYVHEREGATWTGRSLLRAAYGPWLIKHEMWRVTATSNRRFGMGVPSVEAPPGATPAQVTEAQRLASSMRVGDTAGMGLPHGFTAKLTGLSGSVPDTKAFIEYLDQQMSTLALAGFLDLGQTETGSRALGESFVDLFMLSLQAVADEIARVATAGQPGMTGAVTDLVDLNWGEDEPAPRIVCTDVGRRHDLSAEALNGLITSGAITADPELESYLRKAYRLPDRAQEDGGSGRAFEYDLDFGILTIDERRAQIGLDPLPGGQGNRLPEPSSLRVPPGATSQAVSPSAEPGGNGTAPVAARARPRRRRTRPGDSIRAAGDGDAGHRQLTTEEAVSGLDPDAVAAEHQTALEELLAAWAAVQTVQVAALVTQIGEAVDAGDLEALAGLTVDSAEAADVIAQALTEMGETAAARMVSEAASQGVTVEDPGVDAGELAAVAATVAALMAASTAAEAGRVALSAAAGRTGEQVGQVVADHMAGLTDAWLHDQLGGALLTAQAHARFRVLEGAAPALYVASEVLDRATCQPCRDIDGTRFDTLADAAAAYGSGRYVFCQGGNRCRGLVIALWEEVS
jgi:hypothetical protein